MKKFAANFYLASGNLESIPIWNKDFSDAQETIHSLLNADW